MPGGSGASGLVLPDIPTSAGSVPGSSGGSRWSDLSLRVISALVILPVALGCIWAGGFAYLLFVALGCLLLGHEWLTMCGYARADTVFFWFPITVAVVAIASGLGAPGTGLIIVLGGFAAAAVWGRNPGHGGTQGGNHSVASLARRPICLAFGMPYIGCTAVALPWLRADPVAGLPNTLFMLAIIWASDIGAYMVGRLVGGPKLAPAISPGKTWSGAIGGLASAALAGLGVAAWLSSGSSISYVIGLGIVLGIISQAGDLLESALKRHFGVKDSGRIIPGHGGLFDRLDALLAVAPVAALLAFTVGRGVVLWR
jgi:phosphatidate cytidylyltransferase